MTAHKLMNNLKDIPVLITGGCGMVGSHLVDYYFEHGQQVSATHYTHPTIDLDEVRHKAEYIPCDVRDKALMLQIVERLRPQTIYHLAAQSYPTVSWEKPAETIDININGTVNLFEAVKSIRKTMPDYDPMIVIACSSAEYGAALTPENVPIKETAPLQPLHPYGVSKVGQDLLGFQYYCNDGIRNIRARIFNTTGPRKVQDVVSDFTQRAVLWEMGKVSAISVGNLRTQRAITDVRDLIQALIQLADKGIPGEVYNICGDAIYQIADIITIIENQLGKKIPVTENPALLRASDEPIIYGDASKLKACTGWQQSYSLEQTIADMLAYWRKKIS